MRARHAVEAAFLRLTLALLDRAPIGAALGLARALADGWFACDAPRRWVARENILRAGLAPDPAAARRVARASFRHFATLIVESLLSDRFLRPETWAAHITLEIPPETRRLLEDPEQGVILASGHLGNWEIAAQALSLFKPVVGVTRRMNNPAADRIMRERKPRARFRLTPKHDAADPTRFLRELHDGAILALLADQHAPKGGMIVPFFGRPAATHRSIALLHRVSKAPLCFGYCARVAPLRFKLVADAPLAVASRPTRDEDVRAILVELNTRLEAAIRAYPDQYLWAHRRWRVPERR